MCYLIVFEKNDSPFVLDIFRKKSILSFLSVCLEFLKKSFYKKVSILTIK